MDKEIKSVLNHIWFMLLMMNLNMLVLISIAWKIFKKG